jgi:hypothetical protein
LKVPFYAPTGKISFDTALNHCHRKKCSIKKL